MLEDLMKYAWPPDPDEPPLPANPLVLPCDPPPAHRAVPRIGVWPARLAEARVRPRQWVVVAEPMTESTAKQIASDIRSVHRRPSSTIRITGVIEGERWDSRWGRLVADPDPTHCYVWVCWLGPRGSGTSAEAD